MYASNISSTKSFLYCLSPYVYLQVVFNIVCPYLNRWFCWLLTGKRRCQPPLIVLFCHPLPPLVPANHSKTCHSQRPSQANCLRFVQCKHVFHLCRAHVSVPYYVQVNCLCTSIIAITVVIRNCWTQWMLLNRTVRLTMLH